MKRTAGISRNRILLALDRIPFFRAFDAHERERVIGRAQLHVAEAGEYIIRQDSPDDSFYLLLSGSAHVLLNGMEDPVARLEPGEFFGEMSYLLGTPCSCSVVTQETSIVLQVDRRLMGALSPTIREKFKDQIIVKLARLVLESNKQKT